MSSKFRRQTSLALNIILAVTVVILALHKLNRRSVSSAIEVRSQETTNEVSARTVTKETPAFTAQLKLPRYTEVKSESDRRRFIIDQLRAMDVPNEILGRVARVDFEVQWDSRFKECEGDMDKLAEVQLEMNMTKDSEMRAALGKEDFKQWDQDYMLWEAMSTKIEVTAPESEALYGLKKNLQQRMLELDKARLKGTMDDAEINDVIDQAYSTFYQKMKSLLGEERYAKSQQLDDAFVADNFRHQLAKANPTDAQFEELFKVERLWKLARMEVEDQFKNDTFSPVYVEKLRTLDAAHDREYERVLGVDVFNTLRKQQDPVYAQMKKFESLWGLDERKIDYAYNAMEQYHKGVEDYQTQVLALQGGGQGVEWDEVNKHLRQLTEQTQQTLRDQLGQDSFDKLQRNRVLRWATLGPRPVKDGTGPKP